MKILVVSPHPDDETLGAGGSLLKWKNAGNEISWLNITDVDGGGGYIAIPLWKKGSCRLPE